LSKLTVPSHRVLHNYVGVAGSDVTVNIKGGATKSNDEIVPSTCLLCEKFTWIRTQNSIQTGGPSP